MYEIHIGKVIDLQTGGMKPNQVITINEDQLELIKTFAYTSKDKDLNTLYRLNDCQFTVVPKFDIPKVSDEDATIGNKPIEVKINKA